MHPYIPHLLEDIEAGHQTVRPKGRPLESSDLAGVIGEFERMQQEPGHTLGYYAGLKAADFPPTQQLRNKEMQEVCKALRKMMRTWNLRCSLPEGLPVRLVYALLIRALHRRIDPESSFSVVFAYCSRSPLDCPLEKYCTCLKREKSREGHQPNDDRNQGGFIEIKV